MLLFAMLLACATGSVEATHRINVAHGILYHNMQAVWYVAAAALLPPFYALLLPLVLGPYRIVRMPRGIPYRRMFTASACALAYGTTGAVFHLLPASLAGSGPGSGDHVVTWFLLLVCCALLGLIINNTVLIIAIKLTDPAARFWKLTFERDGLVADVCMLSLAVLITLPAAFSPVLLVFVLPIVVVMRRFVMHAQLINAARIDAKTGLLNATTWQREAEVEVSRAIRTGSPLAIAIADIDHFKAVNDEHGHLAGDAVLTLMAATMAALLRDYDVLSRFGGEEFAICLPHTDAGEALRVAERLRTKIAQIGAIAPSTVEVRVTISIGVAVLECSSRSLDELVLAADSALYQAKAAGRNCVKIIEDEPAVRKVS